LKARPACAVAACDIAPKELGRDTERRAHPGLLILVNHKRKHPMTNDQNRNPGSQSGQDQNKSGQQDQSKSGQQANQQNRQQGGQQAGQGKDINNDQDDNQQGGANRKPDDQNNKR
jgi:hypothetical protein